MTRRHNLETLPAFPANYGWLTQHSHSFSPLETTPEAKRAMCETLLRSDKDFLHLLRQCKTSWYVAVVLGVDTVHVNVYEPAEVHDRDPQAMSQPAMLDRAQMFEVDRTMAFKPLSDDQIALVKRTHAMLYSTRCLRLSEIKMLESIAAALTTTVPKSTLNCTVTDEFPKRIPHQGSDYVFHSRCTGLVSKN